MFRQRLEDFLRREVGVATRGLEFWIGLGVGFDDDADVSRQLRIVHFAAVSTSGREAFDTTHARTGFVESLEDGLASPAEAAFGLPRVAITKSGDNLGLEQAALVAFEAFSCRTDQDVGLLDGKVHDACPLLC